ncbi:hypothetical protein CDCA_CDCA07G2024 [Cyanidium caldarium]|uniref:FMN hydroxy acid dehydrogenase domain-containing protein n=1 Tax=Cyanidium caldarium TaxID=2771 RepID=A0AAV9IV26_CYACA|nr:hypothetical protein CDCA_CDCA07G2024 [Cyanidium caldarium]
MVEMNAPALPSQPLNLAEYHILARAKLPAMVYGYYSSGADDEQTLRDNEEAFKRLRFRPRVLIDVSNVDMTKRIMGIDVSFPLLVAPSAMQRMAHPEGELATARAVARIGTVMGLSSWSTTSLEDVEAHVPGLPKFFQLYVYKDRALTERLVKRAEKAGFRAIALTVDTPQLGRREADIRNRFTLPPHLRLANFDEVNDQSTMKQDSGSGLAAYVASLIDASLSWKDVAWLKSITKMPILVKGVVTAEDARRALQAGVGGIWVSNHGARQLDGVVSTIDALEEVVHAVQGRVPVFMDSGVRRGTDVVKALALGADGVLIGRPILWGLAVNGEEGVVHMLQMLKDEFKLAMQLCGCQRVSDIRRDLVIRNAFAPYDVRQHLGLSMPSKM